MKKNRACVYALLVLHMCSFFASGYGYGYTILQQLHSKTGLFLLAIAGDQPPKPYID